MVLTRLTAEQLRFFKVFGFLQFPGLLSDCINDIINEFEAVWDRHGGGHNGMHHDGKKRSCLVPFIDQSEKLSALIDDSRIHDIAASILGDDFNYGGSDGNYYAGDTGWHSDGWSVNPVPSIKIALYLDPLTRDTGALRVMPGSHHSGDTFADKLEEHIRESDLRWHVKGFEVPAFPIESQPGDVSCFYHNTKHASFGGSARRRMFTINCHARYPDDRLDELREQIAKSARHWLKRIYGEEMVRTAGSERMVHLEQFMANDGHLEELSRKKREELAEPARG